MIILFLFVVFSFCQYNVGRTVGIFLVVFILFFIPFIFGLICFRQCFELYAEMCTIAYGCNPIFLFFSVFFFFFPVSLMCLLGKDAWAARPSSTFHFSLSRSRTLHILRPSNLFSHSNLRPPDFLDRATSPHSRIWVSFFLRFLRSGYEKLAETCRTII
jgi:hypothetical protein